MTSSTSFAVMIPVNSFNGMVGDADSFDGMVRDAAGDDLAELEVGLGAVPALGPAGGLRVRLFAGPRRPCALLSFRMSS